MFFKAINFRLMLTILFVLFTVSCSCSTKKAATENTDDDSSSQSGNANDPTTSSLSLSIAISDLPAIVRSTLGVVNIEAVVSGDASAIAGVGISVENMQSGQCLNADMDAFDQVCPSAITATLVSNYQLSIPEAVLTHAQSYEVVATVQSVAGGTETSSAVSFVWKQPVGSQISLVAADYGANHEEYVGVITFDYTRSVYYLGINATDPDNLGTGIDWLIRKYNLDGTEITSGSWPIVRRETPLAVNEYLIGLSVDETTGNIYVSGNLWGNGVYNASVTEYLPDGTLVWDTFRDNNQNDSRGSQAIYDGFIYLCGNKGNDFLVRKINQTTGVETGSYALPLIQQNFNLFDECFDIHVDSTGIYAIGGSNSNANTVVARFDLTGAFDWSNSFVRGGSAGGVDRMISVGDFLYEVTTGLNIVGGSSGSDAVLRKIAKVDGTEDMAFRKIIDFSNGTEEFRQLIWHEQSSSLIVVGVVDGVSSEDGWIKRYFLDGSEDTTYEITWNGPNNDDDAFYEVAIDPNGDIVVGGFSIDYVSHPVDLSQRDQLVLTFAGPE